MARVTEEFKPFKKAREKEKIKNEDFIEVKDHFRIVNNSIKRALKLEDELKEKNALIDELQGLNEKQIDDFERRVLKEFIINEIIETYPDATTDFAFDFFDEIKRDLLKSAKRNFLIINRK